MSDKKRSIGGLWKRSGQYGDYFSGQIEIDGAKLGFKAFSNSYKKEGDKRPEFQIFLDAPKVQQEEETIGF